VVILIYFGFSHHRYMFYVVDYVTDNNFNDLYVYFSILVLKLKYFVKCCLINNGPKNTWSAKVNKI